MSELAGGRASNGGARAQGPVPVSQADRAGPSTGHITTPTDIMRRRREREEARLQAQSSATGSSGQQGRPGAAASGRPGAGVAAQQTSPSLPSQAQGAGRRRSGAEAGVSGLASPSASQQQLLEEDSPEIGLGEIPAAGTARPGQSSRAEPTLPTRLRPTAQSQGQPRPVSQTLGGSTRVPSQLPTGGAAGAGAQRQSGASTTAGPSRPAAQAGTGASSSQQTPRFPHAFERWESLSSYWEGLTSYWIRRLEQNTLEFQRMGLEDIQRDAYVVTLSRQVTDLSQAGGNLFQSVIELQRLRQSSERKFSRWFHETRKEQERYQETIATLQAQLSEHQSARTTDLSRMENIMGEHDSVKTKMQKMLGDKERELDISRGEARRAWEELGRREQEERERTSALREGQAILVGGIQVLPTTRGQAARGSDAHAAAASGVGSHGPRPGTRDGSSIPPPLSGFSGATATAGAIDPEQPSPSNTDPFAESGLTAPPFPILQHQQQPTTSNGVYPPAQPTSLPNSALPASFYEHPSSLLHQQGQNPYQQSSQGFTTGQIPTSSAGGPSIPAGPDPHDTLYAPFSEANSSDLGEQYEYDENGNIRRDQFGQPIIYRRGHLDDFELSDTDEEEAGQQPEGPIPAPRYGQPHAPDRPPPRPPVSMADGEPVGSGVSYPTIPASSTGRIYPVDATTGYSHAGIPATAAGISNAIPIHSTSGGILDSIHAPVSSGHLDHPSSYATAEPVDYSGAGYDWEATAAGGGPTSPYGVVGGRPLSDVVEVDEDERSRVSEASHHTPKATAGASSGKKNQGGPSSSF
jgi:hypothetical protein